MNRSTLVVGGLVIAVSGLILVGAYFGGSPADSSQIAPVPVKVVNTGTKTVTFNISVVPVGDNLTTYRADGDAANLTVTPGSFTLITNGENPTLKIEYPASARPHGSYTLVPGEEQLVNVSPVSSEEAIVVTVYEEEHEHYRAIKTLSCGFAIKGYLIETSPEKEHYTPGRHACGGPSWL